MNQLEFRNNADLTKSLREEILSHPTTKAALQALDEDAPVNSELGSGPSEGYLLGIERGYAMYKNRLLGLTRILRAPAHLEPDYGAKQKIAELKKGK